MLTHKQVISSCFFKVRDRLHHCNVVFTENWDHCIDNLWRKVLHVYILLNLEILLIESVYLSVILLVQHRYFGPAEILQQSCNILAKLLLRRLEGKEVGKRQLLLGCVELGREWSVGNLEEHNILP